MDPVLARLQPVLVTKWAGTSRTDQASRLVWLNLVRAASFLPSSLSGCREAFRRRAKRRRPHLNLISATGISALVGWSVHNLQSRECMNADTNQMTGRIFSCSSGTTELMLSYSAVH